MIFLIFFLLLTKIHSLNYFWLDHNSVISASQYCDQHCFKIASELVIALWCVVRLFNLQIYQLATKEKISFAYRNLTRDKHPLILWSGLCRANFKKTIDNAKAILDEHYRRTKKIHSVTEDIKFIEKYYQDINFNICWWDIWVEDQLGSFDKMKDLFESETPTIFNEIITNKFIWNEDKNICGMTHPPIIFDEQIYKKFVEENNHLPFNKGNYYFIIEAYRYYYKTKLSSVKTKKSKKNESKYIGNLRYFYSNYPVWLLN